MTVFISGHIYLFHEIFIYLIMSLSTLHTPPPDVPPAEPLCFSNVTADNQFLILSCSWDGGAPGASVWWEGPGVQSRAGEENSSVLVLHYGSARSEKPYTCYAQHPLLVRAKTCRLTLGQCSVSAHDTKNDTGSGGW